MYINKLIEMSADILECLHDGIAVVDKNGIILYVNEANFRITGFDRFSLIGKNVRDAVPYSHLPQVIATGKKLIGVKTEIASKAVISNIVPITINGSIEGAISIFRDISEMLNLSKKLEEANSTIEHLYKELNFLSDADSSIVIGKSKAMANILKLSQKASQVTSTVLLEGESGTGKEVIARFIQKHSQRAGKPFIAVNCAAIPESLLESELFGYEEGSFTGARKGGRPGIFELAHEGTIFLDEIGDMNINLQAKLLRVLQEKEVTRIGGIKFRQVDVRVIAATNRNLFEMVENKSFREDLYYRLGVIRILLPPLRERKEDIPLYVNNAMRKIETKIGKSKSQISPKALKTLIAYDYPGNIRELENIIEMSLVTDDDNIIDINDLPPVIIGKINNNLQISLNSNVSVEFDQFPSLEEMEKFVLKNAADTFKSKSEISRRLKISRSTLYRKLEQYGLLENTTD